MIFSYLSAIHSFSQLQGVRSIFCRYRNHRLNLFTYVLITNIFTICLINNSMHQQHFSFGKNKTKGKYALYLASFLIILDVKLC